MNLLIIPELFCFVSTNLSDKKKIFLISCSKIIYNYKLLLKLNQEYNLKNIYNKWYISCTKKIIIDIYPESHEEKIKELLKNLISESIIIKLTYVNFISSDINVKLIADKKN